MAPRRGCNVSNLSSIGDNVKTSLKANRIKSDRKNLCHLKLAQHLDFRFQPERPASIDLLLSMANQV